jgi:hypothetical protein
MSRKQSSDENKFAVLLKGLVKGSSAQFDDPDLIDVEAEDVEDYAALPPAKARMLPPGAAPKKRGRNKAITPPEVTESNPEALLETQLEVEAAVEVEVKAELEVKTVIGTGVEAELQVEAEPQAEIEAGSRPQLEVTEPEEVTGLEEVTELEEVTVKQPEKPPIEKLKPRPWGKSKLEVAPVYDEEGNRKKGRPAKGKRSDGDWAGRTYYVRYTTDTKLEKALWKLRREGLDVDKSDLTDALLNAWAQVELGEVEDSGFKDLIDRVIDRD